MQLPAGANDADLEERILQHLAAAAAMGQARHSARRESHRNRSGIHGRPQFLVFSSHPNSSSTSPPPGDDREGEAAPRIMVASISPPPPAGEEAPQSNASVSPVQTDQSSPSAPQSSSASASQLESPPSERYSLFAGFLEFVSFNLQCVIEFIGHLLILLPCHRPFPTLGDLPVNQCPIVKIELDHQNYNHSRILSSLDLMLCQ